MPYWTRAQACTRYKVHKYISGRQDLHLSSAGEGSRKRTYSSSTSTVLSFSASATLRLRPLVYLIDSDGLHKCHKQCKSRSLYPVGVTASAGLGFSPHNYLPQLSLAAVSQGSEKGFRRLWVVHCCSGEVRWGKVRCFSARPSVPTTFLSFFLAACPEKLRLFGCLELEQ